jgi:hypothetical protein
MKEQAEMRRGHIDALLALAMFGCFLVAVALTDASPLPTTITGTTVLLPGNYSIDDTVTLQPGARLIGYGATIESRVKPGEWSIVLERATQAKRTSLEGIQLKVKTEGANGVHIMESQYARLESVGIVGGTKANRLCETGICIDGGAKGAAFNVLDSCAILSCETGLKLTSDPSRPVFANANTITAASIWACGTGVDIEAGSTNYIAAATQACGTGWRVGKRSKANRVLIRDEKPVDWAIVVEPGARQNWLGGTWQADKVSAVEGESHWERLN